MLDSVLAEATLDAPAKADPAAAHALRQPLAAVPRAPWLALCGRSIEPNVFFDPGFATATAAMAEGGGGAEALLAFDSAKRQRLLGLLPVVSAWRALRLPVPALVARLPYAPLSTPLLDRDHAVTAAGALLDAAAASGARLLLLPDMALDGAAAAAIATALAERGLAALTDRAHARAALDATTPDIDAYFRAGMGAKKLKELRRQRHRLADGGSVQFCIADTPGGIALALERFLDLEARGWKGQRGTGLAQAAGDAAFIRAATSDLGARQGCAVAELTLNGTTIAAGLLLHQGPRAYFFKIAYDETLSRLSPGVQLTLELSRHYAQAGGIALVDSTAAAGHPMIDHVWRERLAIGDLLLPTRRNDPAGPALARLVMLRRRARDEAKHFARFVQAILEKRP